MLIALFGKSVSPDDLAYVQRLVDRLILRKCKLLVYKPFYDFLKKSIDFHSSAGLFETHEQLHAEVNFLFSIGGDGTILDAMTFVRHSGIPIMGINIGRLGFLSSISREEILPAIDGVMNNEYHLDGRRLIKLSHPKGLFGDLNYALNDLTITRKDSTSLIVLHVYIDDLFVNTYWADGLIVATPTGSTAYSLSSGGPILMPGSENFVITPIAPHNLTVRPIVIPDKSRIRIIVEGRAEKFLLSMDSRIATVHSNFELIAEPAEFRVNLVQMKDKDFFSTIREKLKWGLDARN